MRPLSALFLGFLASVYSAAADAQVSDNLVRIGVLGDLSGVYADFGGPGDVVAARMAVEDFGGKVLGKPIDVIAADHQSKTDIGAAIARQWFDADKVDMAIGFDNSSIALAVEQVASKRTALPSLARLPQRCSPARTARPTRQHGSTIITLLPIHLLDRWSEEVGTPGSSSPSIIPSVTLWRLRPRTPFWPAAERS